MNKGSEYRMFQRLFRFIFYIHKLEKMWIKWKTIACQLLNWITVK